MLTCFLVLLLASHAFAAPAQDYLKLLRAQMNASCAQIPHMTLAADEAAKRVASGATLWVTGTQPEFAAEAVERAGGMKRTQPLGDRTPGSADVVLIGLSTAPDASFEHKLHQWRDRGTKLIVFGHRDAVLIERLNIDTWIDCEEAPGLRVGEKLCPTDTVVNLANLWAFTGEFIAACTRRGKLPVIYQSYGLPGGRERAEKLAKQTFHDGLKITPIAPGLLAKEYFERVDHSLDALATEDRNSFEQVASWVTKAGPSKCTAQIIGHIFPVHCRDARAPQLIATLQGELATVIPTDVVLHIGYQKPPQELLDAMVKRPFKFFYSAVELGPQSTQDSVLRINPQWPLADACVEIPGYDVPALPESGVVNAAIYWSIVAEAAMATR